MSVYCKSEPYCVSKYDCEHCARNEFGYPVANKEEAK